MIMDKPRSQDVRITLDYKRVMTLLLINKNFETRTIVMRPIKSMISELDPRNNFSLVLNLNDGYSNILIDP